MRYKNPSYGNRGKNLEELIKISNDNYMRKGEAVVCKIPTEFLPIRNSVGKIVSVKVCGKSTVDFIGRYMGVPVAFEAKQTNGNRIQYSEVKPHQEDFLDAWMKNKDAYAMVVVSFYNLEQFYAIPWAFWKTGLNLWRTAKGMKETVQYGPDTWTTNGKASVSPEELPDAWKIELDNEYVLPYLGVVDRHKKAEERKEKILK